MDLGSGSAMAMPIFGNYMKAVQQQKLVEIVPNWTAPKSDLTIELDCDKFKPENKSGDPFTEE
jgi:penicillin-binding protein 1A